MVDVNESTEEVVQKLTKELEDMRARNTGAEYLIAENEKLQQNLLDLRKQVNHWRNSSNDAHTMLTRISKQGKNIYAEQFYNPALERVVKKLYKENQLLCDAWNGKLKDATSSELIKTNRELTETVQKLRFELEQKFKENQRLIKTHQESDPNKKSNELAKLLNKCNVLQSENRNLKSNLLMQDNIMIYLKKIVDNLRKDFITLFAKCYAEHGEEFITAMKSLDTDGIPEFLLRSLTNDVGTITESSTDIETEKTIAAIERIKIDEGNDSICDSGFSSQSDEVRQLTISLRNSEQSKAALELTIKKKDTEKAELLKTLAEKDREHEMILNDLVNQTEHSSKLHELETKNDQLSKDLTVARNEAMSWSIAINNVKNEAQQFKDERDKAREECQSLKLMIRKAATGNTVTTSHSTSPRKSPELPRQHSYGHPTTTFPEHYQEANQWFQAQIGSRHALVATDCAPPPPVTRPKRQSSDPTSRIDQRDASPKRRNPMEAREDGDEYWTGHVENVLPCEYCGLKFPMSLLFDHMRTCKRQ